VTGVRSAAVSSAPAGAGADVARAWTWWPALALLGLLLGVAWWLLRDATRTTPPPFLRDEVIAERVPEVHHHAADLLHVAGSGSNLRLTRALARAFHLRSGTRVIVQPSIGSRGGIAAVRDGAVEVGLVSRPLTPAERAQGLVEVPYARTPVMVAAHPSVPVDELTVEELVEIYAGERTAWPDGSPIVVLQREPGDSSHRAAEGAWAGFADADDSARGRGLWRVLTTDAELEETLVATPGAIGLHAQGAVVDATQLAALRIGSVAPTLENVRSGAYPATKDLAFVTRGQPQGRIREFLDFVASADGATLITEAGYVVLGAEAP
jgi:phosphate transport system substrate-binding protein